MRRLEVWALVLAFVLAAAGMSARAADDDDGAAPRSGWFTRWFGKTEKKPAAQKKSKKAKEHKAEKPADRATLNDHLARLRSRARANFFRRLEVCIKLRQVAIDTQDDELLAEVKVLEKRVWEACRRHLDIKQDVDPFESDEDILDRHLGETGHRAADDEQVLIEPVPGINLPPVAAENKR